jgi:CubicO group peptidase (beta-lactamase class C family)
LCMWSTRSSRIRAISSSEIIRAVSGEPWDAFLQKRLFQPLAMGRYQPNPAITVMVSREGDKLMFESAGGKVELLPESENSFFSIGLPVTISFVKDDTGTVTDLVLRNNGREAGRARKID